MPPSQGLPHGMGHHQPASRSQAESGRAEEEHRSNLMAFQSSMPEGEESKNNTMSKR